MWQWIRKKIKLNNSITSDISEYNAAFRIFKKTFSRKDEACVESKPLTPIGECNMDCFDHKEK